MTKKHFIALADRIRRYRDGDPQFRFTQSQILILADFCQSQNPNFDRDRWVNYIAGKCGPSGGKRKVPA